MTDLLDTVQLIQRYLKDVGITAELKLQEFGAYLATTAQGKFDGLAYGLCAIGALGACAVVCDLKIARGKTRRPDARENGGHDAPTRDAPARVSTLNDRPGVARLIRLKQTEQDEAGDA